MVTSNIDAHMRRVCCIKKNRFFKKKQKYSKGEMCVLAAGQDEWRTSAVVFIFFGQHSEEEEDVGSGWISFLFCVCV
jgi:hypothetical protein